MTADGNHEKPEGLFHRVRQPGSTMFLPDSNDAHRDCGREDSFIHVGEYPHPYGATLPVSADGIIHHLSGIDGTGSQTAHPQG